MNNYKVYLVGGAVRDELLGLTPHEKDYVVVGAAPYDLLAEGFKQVGKDFPVFLHPATHEEYALARLERDTAAGYAGFSFDTSKSVTLEQDLKRRDLTINAMAQTLDDNKIIDPYDGQKDIEAKVLRHVSDAFVEDPVRILRIARFAARFACLGFKVAPETLTLMVKMVDSGEVSALVAERVWKELVRALAEPNPEVFFEVLDSCDALKILLPELLPFSRAKLALQNAVKVTHTADIRFAVLLHYLSCETIKVLCERLRVPKEFAELAAMTSQYLLDYRQVVNMNAYDLVGLLQSVDAFRRQERFEKWLQALDVCSVDSGVSKYLQRVLVAAKSINTAEIAKNVQRKEIATSIRNARVEAIENLLQR